MNRRSFIKKAVVTATAAIIAPDLILPNQYERRVWALDRTMVHAHEGTMTFQFPDLQRAYTACVHHGGGIIRVSPDSRYSIQILGRAYEVVVIGEHP
jgi:hypothetical protein